MAYDRVKPTYLYLSTCRKSVGENSDLLKIGQEWRVLYVKNNVNLWLYLAKFCLEWEIFQTKVVEKIETHFVFNTRLWDNVEKYGRAGETTWQYGACAFHARYVRLRTHTLRIRNSNRFLTATVTARTRLNVTLSVHCLSCNFCKIYTFCTWLFECISFGRGLLRPSHVGRHFTNWVIYGSYVRS